MRRNHPVSALLSHFAVLAAAAATVRAGDVSAHSVVWNDLLNEPGQSEPVNNRVFATFHNAMPVGNGHITAMVTYEAVNDSLAVMISAASSWVENGEAAKVGLLNIHLPSRGGEAVGAGFRQAFNPQEATVRFSIPPGGSATGLELVVYADADTDTIIVSTTPPDAAITTSWTPLKPTPRTLPGSSDCQYYSVSADVLSADGKLLYHRNAGLPEDSYMVQTLRHTNVKGDIDGFGEDPMMNRSTGALVGQVPVNTSTTFAVAVLTSNTRTASEFEAQIRARLAAFTATASAFPPAQHLAWWRGKWAQHAIEVGPSTGQGHQRSLDTVLISQKYVWQRFVELSQARSPFPIKFNTMMYGANRPPYQDENTWGGLNWWQNLRMPYYNMLTAGDAEEMKTLFESFNRTVPIARSRTRAYFGFEGIWWPEYTHVFYGTPHPGGKSLPLFGYRAMTRCTPEFPGEPDWHSDDTWNGYNRQGSLDLSLMILDRWAYTAELEPEFLAIAVGVVQFYANLWGNTTAAPGSNGRMVFFPTQALETWQCPGWPVNVTDCPTNDMPTIAGLHAVIEKLLRLPVGMVSPSQVDEWTKLRETLPLLPSINGSHAPCDNCVLEKDGGHGPGCHRTRNSETAELYSVHPYRQATIARAKRGDSSEWSKANRAFNADPLARSDRGWKQTVMNAALLGNASVAAKFLIERARTPVAPGYRFPGFAPRMQDAAPSADHYAVFSNALQYMLIQRADDDDESVVLLPAWPCEWSVNFTLAAPRQTKITGSVRDGVLNYSVDPASRASAVTAAPCQEVGPPPPPGPPPPGPPGAGCDMAAWKQLCRPMPGNVSECMRCCDEHKADLFKLNCIGTDCWPDFCAAKPAPGCRGPH